jgi:hypothetical protein
MHTDEIMLESLTIRTLSMTMRFSLMFASQEGLKDISTFFDLLGEKAVVFNVTATFTAKICLCVTKSFSKQFLIRRQCWAR